MFPTNQKIYPQNNTFNLSPVIAEPSWSLYVMIDVERIKRGNDSTIGDPPVELELTRLNSFSLTAPLKIIVQPDGEGWLAETIDYPLYCYDETYTGAIEGLKLEIEDVYYDLMKDNDFSPSWLEIKNQLKTLLRVGE